MFLLIPPLVFPELVVANLLGWAGFLAAVAATTWCVVGIYLDHYDTRDFLLAMMAILLGDLAVAMMAIGVLLIIWLITEGILFFWF